MARVNTWPLAALLVSIAGSVGATPLEYLDLLARGDCAAAIPQLHEAAPSEPATAGYYLALCLERLRDGAAGDATGEIETLLRRAAAAGKREAHTRLAIRSFTDGDRDEARAWARRDGDPSTRLEGLLIEAIAAPGSTGNARTRRELLSAVREGDLDALRALASAPGFPDVATGAEEGAALELALRLHRRDIARWLIDEGYLATAPGAMARQLRLALVTKQEELALSLIDAYSARGRGIPVEELRRLVDLAAHGDLPRAFGRIVAAITARGYTRPLEPALIAYLYDRNDPDLLALQAVRSLGAVSPRRDWLMKAGAADDARSGNATLLERAANAADWPLVMELARQDPGFLATRERSRALLNLIYLKGGTSPLLDAVRAAPRFGALSDIAQYAIDLEDVAMIRWITAQATYDLAGTAVESSPLWHAIDAPAQIWEPLADWQDADGAALLIQAIRSGNSNLALRLARRSEDVLRGDAYGRGALWWAADRGESRLVSLLVQRADEIDLPDRQGQTPLMRGVLRGNELVVRTLLASGAAIDAKSGAGNTALMFAAMGNPAIVDLLVAKRAAVRERNATSRTALMIAAERGCVECVATLVRAGGNPRRKDAYGKSAFDLAANGDVLRALGR